MELTTQKTNKNYLIAGILTIACAGVIGLLFASDIALDTIRYSLDFLYYVVLALDPGFFPDAAVYVDVLAIAPSFFSEAAVYVDYRDWIHLALNILSTSWIHTVSTVFVLSMLATGILLILKQRKKFMVFFPLAGVLAGASALLNVFRIMICNIISAVIAYGRAPIGIPLNSIFNMVLYSLPSLVGYLFVVAAYAFLAIVILSNGGTNGGKMKIFKWLSPITICLGYVILAINGIGSNILNVISIVQMLVRGWSLFAFIEEILATIFNADIFVAIGSAILLPVTIFFVAHWFTNPYKKAAVSAKETVPEAVIEEKAETEEN